MREWRRKMREKEMKIVLNGEAVFAFYKLALVISYI